MHNIERLPSETVSRGAAFRTLCNQIHRYSGILKIHIIKQLHTGILYEPVYRPALPGFPGKDTFYSLERKCWLIREILVPTINASECYCVCKDMKGDGFGTGQSRDMIG